MKFMSCVVCVCVLNRRTVSVCERTLRDTFSKAHNSISESSHMLKHMFTGMNQDENNSLPSGNSHHLCTQRTRDNAFQCVMCTPMGFLDVHRTANHKFISLGQTVNRYFYGPPRKQSKKKQCNQDWCVSDMKMLLFALLGAKTA